MQVGFCIKSPISSTLVSQDVENLNLSEFVKGVCLILKLAIKKEKPLKDFLEDFRALVTPNPWI